MLKRGGGRAPKLVWRTLFPKSHSLLRYLTWQRLNSNLNIMSGPPAFLSQTPPKQNSSPGLALFTPPPPPPLPSRPGAREMMYGHTCSNRLLFPRHRQPDRAPKGQKCILTLQITKPDRWCGAVAVDRGWKTFLQVSTFVKEQPEHRKWKGGHRVEMERFTYSEVFLYCIFFQIHTHTHRGR